MDFGDLANEVSGGNKDSVRNWAGGLSCFILTKALTLFCPCDENLHESRFKVIGQASKTAPQVKMLIAKSDDLNLISRTHTVEKGTISHHLSS